jgi:hypothetical protein
LDKKANPNYTKEHLSFSEDNNFASQYKKLYYKYRDYGYQSTNLISKCDKSGSQYRKNYHKYETSAYQFAKSDSHFRKSIHQYRKYSGQWGKTFSQWRKSVLKWIFSYSEGYSIIDFCDQKWYKVSIY